MAKFGDLGVGKFPQNDDLGPPAHFPTFCGAGKLLGGLWSKNRQIADPLRKTLCLDWDRI
jgi:hypothetical protein